MSLSPDSLKVKFHGFLDQLLYFFEVRLACFKTLFSVSGGISMLGFPETVTVPGFFE